MATVSGASLAPIYNRLAQTSGYHPGSGNTFADWSTQSGDIVSMKQDGVTYNTPVFATTMKWNGSPTTTLESSGKKHIGSVEAIAKQKFETASSGYRNSYSFSRGLAQETYERVGSINTVNGRVDVFEGSDLWVSRDNITGVTGKFYKDANGKIHIIEGSGLLMDRESASFGLYDEGNLTGGIMVEKINDGTTTTRIKGTRVIIGDDLDEDMELPDWIDTTEGLIAEKATIVDLNAVKARVGTLETDYLKTSRLYAQISLLPKVTAQTIEADTVKISPVAGMAAVNVATAYNGSSLTLSGNTYTLILAKMNGTYDSYSFSRATSLSGSWSGGTYTVTASPQNETKSTTILMGITNTSTGDAIKTITSNGKQKIYAYYQSPLGNVETGASSVVDIQVISPTSLSGNWSDGTYTVTASPQSVTHSTTILMGITNTSTGNATTTITSNGKQKIYAYYSSPLGNVETGASSIIDIQVPTSSASISGPTWATAPASDISGNSNTATYTAGSSTASLALYMSSGSWSSGKKYVYVTHTDSTDAHRIARYSVSISTSDISVPATWPSASTEYTSKDQTVTLNKNYTYHMCKINVHGVEKKVMIKLIS